MDDPIGGNPVPATAANSCGHGVGQPASTAAIIATIPTANTAAATGSTRLWPSRSISLSQHDAGGGVGHQERRCHGTGRSVGPGPGGDQQHDAEADHGDRQPGGQPADREHPGSREGQHPAIGRERGGHVIHRSREVRSWGPPLVAMRGRGGARADAATLVLAAGSRPGETPGSSHGSVPVESGGRQQRTGRCSAAFTRSTAPRRAPCGTRCRASRRPCGGATPPSVG